MWSTFWLSTLARAVFYDTYRDQLVRITGAVEPLSVVATDTTRCIPLLSHQHSSFLYFEKCTTEFLNFGFEWRPLRHFKD